MTRAQFFRELAKLKGKFRISPMDKRSVRCKRGDCPIVAVARKLAPPVNRYDGLDNGEFIAAGRRIGLRAETAQVIARAADGDLSWGVSEALARAEMLKVLGLSVSK